MTPNRLFNLISLGCPKNRVDSERILSVMTSAGFVYSDDPSTARVLIVNTCAFIEPAVEESIDTILDYRAGNKKAFLVVTGCLPLRYRKGLTKAFPEVDLFVTPDRIGNLPELLTTSLTRSRFKRSSGLHSAKKMIKGEPVSCLASLPRMVTTSGYAYLKIAEGCSRRCRYCTIPSIRGPMHSFDADALEQEAASLAAQGIQELVLVAQDLSSYGLERGEKGALSKLIKKISLIREIKWIRLMYLHPDVIPNGLPRLIRETRNVLPYLDIPIQHISASVLKAMGRPWKGDRIRKLIDRLRSEIPGLVLRTTLMVGYPTEGEKEFRELRDFVVSSEIERVGVFTYSPEEGTRAHELGDPVPMEVKEARAEEIRSIHWRLSDQRNRARIGAIEDALIEGVSPETEFLLQGRVWDQAPEFDGILYVTAGNAVSGEIHEVRITGSFGSDLFGEII